MQFQEISPDNILPCRYQPRTHFSEEALAELSQSILEHGVLEPLLVRPVAANRFELIAGERRLRAAKMAGLLLVPCMLADMSNEEVAILALIENIQRADLTALEEARAYERLMLEFSITQDDAARRVGKSRSHVANMLRLLKLSPALQNMLMQGVLSQGHAKMLVALPETEQEMFAEKIMRFDWSVRKLEDAIRKYKQHTPDSKETVQSDKDIARLTRQLAEQLGAPVEIEAENQREGWLKVKFFNNDTLAGLLERMGLRYD